MSESKKIKLKRCLEFLNNHFILLGFLTIIIICITLANFIYNNFVIIKDDISHNISADIVAINLGEEFITDPKAERTNFVVEALIEDIEKSVEVFETEIDIFSNPEYVRTIYVTEYEIAPISEELVAEFSMEEETYLSAIVVDSKFKSFSQYEDARTGKIRTLPMSENGQKLIYKYAKKYGLPYKYVLAILGVETHWNEDPKHVEVNDGTRYIGIGCLTEKYHAEKLKALGIDIYTLEGNIEGLCYILKGHLDTFDGDIFYAMMAYNGGPGYARNQKKDGVKETEYTKKVMCYVNSFK